VRARSTSWPVVAAVAATLLAACSGDSSQADQSPAPTSPSPNSAVPTSPDPTGESTPIEDGPLASAPERSVATVGENTAESTAPAASEPAPAPSEPPVVATSPATVPETGVPGLDSDDAFCAAWSRFAGTWQVLLVGATFLDDPGRVAQWEVVASSVVLEAYDDLLEHLPAGLEPERQLLVDGYFGVLARRAEAAADALAAADPDGDAAQSLGEQWLDALAGRDPSTPDLDVDLPDELEPVVEDAAGRLQAARVPIGIDPSMNVTVETPLTDEFLTTCPDQGTLAGGEVGG
jgi:hypothetical protein